MSELYTVRELYTDEAPGPKLFECFIDRAEASLPEHFLSAAKGVLVAHPDLIGSLGDFSRSGYTWKPNLRGDGFDSALPKERRILQVKQIGQFWYIQRIGVDRPDRFLDFQVLVFPFENVPFCTRTCEDAMRLAEHCSPMPCSPMPHPPVPGCWVELE